MRKDKDFEAQKEALMKEVRSVLQEVENLYDAGVESGTVEAKALKAKAQAQLGKVKSQFADFEAAAHQVSVLPNKKASQVWLTTRSVICSFAGFHRPKEGRYPGALDES